MVQGATPMKYLDQRLFEIHNTPILEFLAELEHASRLSRTGLENLTLFLFMTQCLYPNGAGTKRIPLHPHSMPVAGYLGTPIERLRGTSLYELCEELAYRANLPLEMHINRKLMTFLNTALPRYAVPRKRKR
jgi:hypothetical protein